jgi:hypothetical protein
LGFVVLYIVDIYYYPSCHPEYVYAINRERDKVEKVYRCVITWELGSALHFSQDVMTIHGRVGDGGVAERRGQARHCRVRRLCGVESGEMTEVSDAGLHPRQQAER